MTGREIVLSEQPAANLYGSDNAVGRPYTGEGCSRSVPVLQNGGSRRRRRSRSALYRYQRLQYPQQRFHAVYRGEYSGAGAQAYHAARRSVCSFSGKGEVRLLLGRCAA